MSRIVYYLGAGASYGARDGSGGILEGLPVVSEVPSQFDEFRDAIAKAKITEGRYIAFQSNWRVRPSDISDERDQLLEDIDSLRDSIRQHATIDTYARKLYLTGDTKRFEMLKGVLCVFFMWEQLVHATDNRYDTFLANVLEAKTLMLPRDVSILSWNYDSQIELAYRFYKQDQKLPVFERNLQGDWPELPNGGRIFKVNGSATFADKSVIQDILTEKGTSIEIQLVQFYTFARAETTIMGFQYKTHLSFAWEDSMNQKNMMDSINATVEDAEEVVVIGYSFPFFNRETDRQIFRAMPHLKKVYIQDKNPEAVCQTIEAVLPAGSKIHLTPISDCTQFYLPSEL